MTEERKHSSIGASSASRWLQCPGSIRLSKNAPRQLESKYAAEGTKAHEVAEKMLRGHMILSTDEAMIEHATTYRSFVLSCLQPEGQLFIEHELNLSCYDAEAFGTADAVVVNETDLWVIDYKYGAGYAVEVEENPQLRFYALGALFSLPKADQSRIKVIHMAIVQPRAHHDDGPIRIAEMSKKNLTQWGGEVLKPGMAATKDPNAPIVEGSWCRWCPAITVCPKQGRLPVAVSAQSDFADTSTKLPAPAQLTPEQIGIALQARPQVEAWFSAIDALARSELEQGRGVPGWKLVEGRKQRSWKDELLAEEILSAAYGDLAFTKKLLSPAAAEKLGFDAPTLVATFTTNSSLVPENDRRQCLSGRSATDDFKE